MKKIISLILVMIMISGSICTYGTVNASDSQLEYEYAYIEEIYFATNMDERNGILTLMLITENGLDEYIMSGNTVFCGSNGKSVKLNNTDIMSRAATCLKGTLWEEISESEESVMDTLTYNFDYYIDETAEDTAMRTVKITADEKQKIISITPLLKLDNTNSGFKYSVQENVTYSLSDNKIGTESLVLSAPVLKLDFDRFSYSDYYDTNYIKENERFSAIVIDKGDDSKFRLAIVYGGNPFKNMGVTSLSYDVEKSKIGIISKEAYNRAFICASAYKNGNLVSIDTFVFPLYDDNVMHINEFQLENFSFLNADTVKFMVFETTRSLSPLCRTYEFDESYLSQFRNMYGYITDAYYNSRLDEMKGKATLQLVTNYGYLDCPLADEVSFVGRKGECVTLCTDDMISDASKVLTGSAWTELVNMNSAVGDVLNDAFSKDAIVNDNDDASLRTVRVTIDNNKEICSVTPLIFTSDYSSHVDYTIFSGKFDADKNFIGTNEFSYKPTTICINYEEPSKTVFEMNGTFVDGWEYKGLAIDSNSDGIYNCAVITDYIAKYTDGDSVAIVKNKYQSKGANGKVNTKINVYKNGEEESLIFDSNSFFGYGSHSDFDDVDIGSVITYVANRDGKVLMYDVIGNVTFDGGKKTFAFDEGFKNSFSQCADYKNGESYFHGYIAKRSGADKLWLCIKDSVSDGNEKNDMESIATGNDSTSVIDVLYCNTNNANMYTLTGTKKTTAKIQAGDYMYGNVDKMYLVDNMGTSTATDDKYEVYYVLVKMYEGVVTDIISFDVPQNVASIVTPFDGTPCE